MRFDKSFLEDICARVPLSSIVGKHVSWTKKSRPAAGDYWGCCPAHAEKGASFHVMDKKGFCKCFACGFSAGHLKFLQEIEGLSFPRAVEVVAEMAGMPLPNAGPPTKAEIAERARRDRARAAAAARQAEQAAKDKERRVKSAGAIWKETTPLAGTAGADYFEWRGLPVPTDENLRFHLGLEHPELPGRIHPAIVARVQGPDGAGVGIWRIYLRFDGRGKPDGVESAKLGLGPTAGGAVRLGGIAKHIGLAEGVETSRAVNALGWSMPIWAGLSTSGIIGFKIPDGVETVTVFPDRDGSKVRTREDGTVKRSPGLAAYAGFVERNPGRDIRLAPGSETDDYLETLQKVRGLPVR